MLAPTIKSSAIRRLAPSARRTASNWTGHLSFASPESDFSGALSNPAPNTAAPSVATKRKHSPTWSQQLSFTSPEADFVSQAFEATAPAKNPFQTSSSTTTANTTTPWSGTLSFASPESDFCTFHPLHSTQTTNSNMDSPLPASLAHALVSSSAVVVTTPEAPHRVVAVNRAWETLCGYTQKQVLGKTLSFLQGTETNLELVNATIDSVRERTTTKAEMYVVNYKADGSPFVNHVTVGRMPMNTNAESGVEFMVGVLESVKRAPLRMV